MTRSSSTLLLPLLYIIAVATILFFQFKSHKSVKQLIGSNEELLNEINYKNKFQQLQTHLATFDKLVREAVITKGAVEDNEIKNEIQLIDSTMDYINDKQPYEDVNAMSALLDSLVDVKVKNGIDILNEYVDKGKQKAELMVYDHNKQNTNEVILRTIKDLEKLSEQKVKSRVSEIDRNERNAMWSNIMIAIGASFFLLLSLGFIYFKIKQQQRLIFQLNLSKEKEKKSAKIKDDFLANMSHEIRTPLNAILGFTDLLEKENLNRKASQFVSTIKTSGSHLMEIVNEILDIAKIEEGMIRIEHAPFSLKELIQVLDHSFRDRIEEKGICFLIDWQAGSIDLLSGDEYRLTQILNNLLSNALKFTQRGEISLQINCLNIDRKTCLISFRVSDTGIGISEAEQKTIFERFAQGDAQITRKYGGTGLGLSIVKQLVDLQHGTIQLTSEAGKGSTFCVDLPFELGDEYQDANKSANDLIELSVKTGLRVLIVEDNRINQQLLEHWLEAKQIQYTIAVNGFEAISAFAGHNFDIVLMDIQMPEMDGYEVSRHIRSTLKSHIPIIAMTAHALNAEKMKCLMAGMNDYLSKPILEKELFRMINLFTASTSERIFIRPDYLYQLSNGNFSFCCEMIQQFQIQAPQELQLLWDAIEQKDLSKVKSTAHSMKTTFGYMGISAPELMVLEELEKTITIEQPIQTIDRLMKLYKGAYNESIQLLTELNEKLIDQ